MIQRIDSLFPPVRSAFSNVKTAGQVLVMYSFSMFLLMGLAALAIDVGRALNTKREFQQVAAVCAVVGAARLPQPVATATAQPAPTVAIGAATSSVTRN